MLETYGIPFPADSVDSVETEESDWWERGPGGVATAGRPPRPRPSLVRGTRRVWVIPGTECKKYKK